MAALVARVLTVSDGVAEGTREDKSGVALVERLKAADFKVDEHSVCADGKGSVTNALRDLAKGFSGLIVTTGGTGFGPRDLTPEGTLAAIEREAPGLAEAVRRYGVENGVPTSVLSRGLAGTAGRTLIVNLPGSTGGVKDALAVLGPLLAHVVSQLRGGDH